MINNALNEVCNGLPFGDEEFQTRIGYSRELALKVLENRQGHREIASPHREPSIELTAEDMP